MPSQCQRSPGPAGRGAAYKLAAWLWYRGGPFVGFQRQRTGRSIQGELFQALAKLGLPQHPPSAGRTDRGVHARMQVVRLRGPPQGSSHGLRDQLRAWLPPEIGIAELSVAPRNFHPQWRCQRKQYRYRFALGPPPPSWTAFCWNAGADPALKSTIRIQDLSDLIARIPGTRTYRCFQEGPPPGRLRRIDRASLAQLDDGLWEIQLVGDAFGRYQVRYLIGSVLAVAAGTLSEADFLGALTSDLPIRGIKAPASGLVLWEVYYPAEVDPFTEAARARGAGLPEGPPF